MPYADKEKRANYERNRCPEASKARVEKHRSERAALLPPNDVHRRGFDRLTQK